MVPRRRQSRVVAAIIVLGGLIGSAGIGAAPAFAAARSGSITPNGAGISLQFTAGGQTGTVTVQGLVGQQLTVSTSGGTFASNCGLQLSLVKPAGGTLAGPQCAGQSGSVSSASLPGDGLYKASFVAGAGATGTVAVAATSSGGPRSITVDAPALTVAVTAPSQDVRFGFSGRLGTKYVATTASGSLPDCNVSLQIVKPDGTPVGPSIDSCAANSGSAEATITKKGTYAVRLLHNGTTESGTVSVALYTGLADVAGTLTLGGTPTPVAVANPGQNARYTFSGTTGQRVAAQLTSSTFGPSCPAVSLSLVRPDGSALGSPASTCGSTVFRDTQTLDQTGTWAVLVDPQAANTGGATLTAFTSIDQIGTIARNGNPENVVVTTPGQNARFTFAGTAGEGLSAVITNSTATGCPAVAVAFLRPDGTQDTTIDTCTDTAVLDAITLDQTGTWTVLVDPQGAATGTATLQAYDKIDNVHAVNVNGAPVNVLLSSPGQNGSYTFAGTAGQKISAQMSLATFPGCPAYVMSLVGPDGSTLGTGINGCGADGFLDAHTLDQTGTWTVRVNPNGTATGTAKLNVYTFVDQTGTTELTGKTTKLVFSKPGQNALLTFAGTAGQGISAYVRRSEITGCPAFAVSLVRPNGSTLAGPVTTCTDNAFIDTTKLDATGTWTIFVDPQGTGTGIANLQAYVVVDANATIRPNGVIKSFTTLVRGQNAYFHFNGTAGNSRTVTISGSTFPGCPGLVVSFLRPNSTVLSSASTCNADLVLGPSVLDATGGWTILVDPQGPAQGTLIIKVT